LIARLFTYLIGVCLIAPVAFAAGEDHYDTTHCARQRLGDCDLGGLGGMEWAAIAVVGFIGVVVAYELYRQR
jgi:hypothetical protein